MLAPIITALLRDPALRAELVAILRDAAPPPSVEPTALLTAAQLAKRLGISTATVRRLEPPAVIVGDAASKRYDLAEVRAFLAAREPKATTPAKREADVDVSGALAAAGIRHSAGGGR